MMKTCANHSVHSWTRRLVAGLLCLVLVCGLLPATEARAAHWAQPYLDKLVSWGVLRENQDPNQVLTRADFAAMINRAFGYKKVGPTPFTDVRSSDWFAEDIAIAWNMGYMTGTSPTTASPNAILNREQAVVLLGRNLMLHSDPGESLSYTDSRSFADWSRGIIKAATGSGIINGYDDGSFRPYNEVRRGEMAAMLVRAIGTLVNQPGTTTLGTVTGNVTISTSGVTLKDTVIMGNLYLTGGIGQGEVLLDNVTVLGKIVASGAGEGASGTNSVILRNSRANELLVESIANQFVTIEAQGNTTVEKTEVRSSSYLEDRTAAGLGLKLINLEAGGIGVQLAGNIKEVVNRGPSSLLTVAQGAADKITVDEAATGSQLQILNGARVKELRLDVGTTVSGTGDIDDLTIYSDGSTVAQLPNTITVRPGVIANVNNEVMDTVTAAESSEDPRLLSGYPAAKNIAPATADAVFSTNKRGTIYWALTAVADGSVSQQDLISPPAYSNRIIASGSIVAASSKTEYTAKLTRLTSDGSYYISAVMVDNRGQISPVKVTAFTTPDNSVPAFGTGYPTMYLITSNSGQVAVMPTKTCQLYYAILPKGSVAPTVNNFRTGSISGALGYGVREVTKNVIDFFNVNSQSLREQTEYDVYLCLYDADGGQNSGVKKLTFKTLDGTPPTLTGPTVSSIQRTSVGLTATMNEPGTLYWVVVAADEEYPKPLAGQAGTPALDSELAKLQVMNGMNGLKSGNVRSTAANRAMNFTVSGLTEQTAYDLYYLAVDSAGNSRAVQKMRINTLDTSAPEVSLEFTKTSDTQGERPMADTDLKVVFSEGVQDSIDNAVFLEVYTAMIGEGDPTRQAELRRAWADLVRTHITLMDGDSYTETPVLEKNAANENNGTWDSTDWVDYRYVSVEPDQGKIVFIFRNGEAVRLNSGGRYYFKLANIADTSNNKNLLRPNPMNLPSPPFQTDFAQVNLRDESVSAEPIKFGGNGTETARVDMSFKLHPLSTGAVSGNIMYDVLLWCTTSVKYDLYVRVLDARNAPVKVKESLSMFGDSANLGSIDTNGWIYLGNNTITTDGVKIGNSVNALIHKRQVDLSQNYAFFPLSGLKEDWTYEFAIEVTAVEDRTNPAAWSKRIEMGVSVPAGTAGLLRDLASPNSLTESGFADYIRRGVVSIGVPEDFSVSRQFTDTLVPEFQGSTPSFRAGDTMVTMNLRLDREGTVYYALAPVLKKSNATGTGSTYWEQPYLGLQATIGGTTQNVYPTNANISWNPPTAGIAAFKDSALYDKTNEEGTITDPTNTQIYLHQFQNAAIKYGNVTVGTDLREVTVSGLMSETTYLAYFVVRSASQQLGGTVYCFQFTTNPADTPIITLTNLNPEVSFRTSTDAYLDYALVAYNQVPALLKEEFATYATTGFNAASYAAQNGLDGDTSSFSVLDALLADGGTGYGSVFDRFAKPLPSGSGTDGATTSDIRTRVADYIRGQLSLGGRLTFTGSFAGANYLRADDPKNTGGTGFVDSMTVGTQYYCLAVAHNTGGTTDAYKALRGVQRPDDIPPEFQSVETAITGYYELGSDVPLTGDDIPDFKLPTTNANRYTYSGRVTINFSKPVYFIPVAGDATAKPVLVSGKDATTTTIKSDTDTAVYLENHIQVSFKDYTTTERGTAANTIVIYFNQISINDTIRLFADGYVSNSSSASNSKALLLRLADRPRQSETVNNGGGSITSTVINNPAFVYSWVD